MRKKTFTIGGIHPDGHKEASPEIELLPLPETAVMPLRQHIGAPATPCVAKGDRVRRGEIIATNPSFVSAGLHAPISGTITAIGPVTMADGKPSQAIIIKADPGNHEADTEARRRYWDRTVPGQTDRNLCENSDANDIRLAISAAGIVGLGGATFPSHVKLTPNGEKTEILIINGCECEPYLMCDDALMRTYPARIAEGVELMLKASGIRRAVIAIEDNKPEAIGAISSALDRHYDISLQVLRTRYPQGGEKQLVETITGHRIASGKLPASVGAIVNNVATAFAVWQAVDSGVPLIERIVTVAGDIPENQKRNYLVALGTPFSEFPLTIPPHGRLIAGGPMMGRTSVRTDAPVTKGTSGLTVLAQAARRPEQACIRCGACVSACPMGLEPYLLSTYGRTGRWADAHTAHVNDCIECGSCSYICPSSRPLLDYIRVAKQRCRQK